MSLYYPQGAVILRVTWEDFGTGAAALQEVQDIPISCRSLTVERNDYSEADTFKATIDYKAFPFDPRCIRACGVTICMEDRKKVFNSDNSLNIIEPSADNTVFLGFADEGSINCDDDTRTVTLEGRDYTALLVDTKRVNSDPIPLSSPIEEIIQELISELKSTKDIEVVNRTGESPLPTPSKLGKDFNATTAVKNQKRRETYWDIIQDIVSRVGLVGFIELDKFIITKPQNIYEKKEIKQFIYGANVKNFSLSRKLGRSKNFNVKVRSLNLRYKRVEEAMIPEEATDEKFVSNFGKMRITIPELDKNKNKVDPPKDADFFTFAVKDVNNKEQLIKIGESIYEEMSRQQIEGKLTTYEMEIPEEAGDGFNVIKFSKIRNGTAIRMLLSQAELGELKSTSSKEDKKTFLLRRGYPAALAEAFADSLNRINTAFYVRAVTFKLDQDNGFSMDIEFINFIDLDSSLVGA